MDKIENKFTHEEMIEAVRSNDSSYDGKFYLGVKTTGIYCLPSCRAKRPNLENMVFFEDRRDAIAAGFRGCKRCRAESYPDVYPDWLVKILTIMRDERSQKIDERELTGLAGVDISTIRRAFKLHFQTTPLAFHRRIRLVFAGEKIGEGVNYLQAAYECGFQSASGFRDAFVKEYGIPPGKYYERRSDRL
jgi:AraC family transcriptional regulator of adaptative response/methylated-DNA-[protein]-cysteine methyltransferase